MRSAFRHEADTHTTLPSPAGLHVAALRTGRTAWAKDVDGGIFECHAQRLGAPAAIAAPSRQEISEALYSREQWRRLAEERRKSEQKLHYGSQAAEDSEETLAANVSACDGHLPSPDEEEGLRIGRLVLPAIYELQAANAKPRKTQSQMSVAKDSPVSTIPSPRRPVFDKSSSPADVSPAGSANASFSTKSRHVSPIRLVGAPGLGRATALMPSPRPQAELTLTRSALQSQSFTLGKAGATAWQPDLLGSPRRAGPDHLFSPRSGLLPSSCAGPLPMQLGLRGSSFTFGSGHGGGVGGTAAGAGSLAKPLWAAAAAAAMGAGEGGGRRPQATAGMAHGLAWGSELPSPARHLLRELE